MECSLFRALDSLFISTPPEEISKIGTSKRLFFDAQSTDHKNCCQAMNEQEVFVPIFYDANSLQYSPEKQGKQETVAAQSVSQHLF
jgi:hypothetical protein